MKKLIAFMLTAVLCAALAGCGEEGNGTLADQMGGGSSSSSSVASASSSSSAPESGSDSDLYSTGLVISGGDGTGYYDGRMGDTMRTAFFDYTVNSAELVDEYAGYTPAEGMTLLDSVITVKNTFGESIPMFNSDFQIQWGDGDEDYGYGVEGLVDATIMPESYEQKRGETVTYHVVYEVPAEATEFSISYLEIYEDNSEGDVFFVFFEL